MSKDTFQLRAYVYLDSLQPQLVDFLAKGKEHVVLSPKALEAGLLIEITPAMDIHSIINTALKKTAVRLGAAITERRYGAMLIQHPDQGEVKEAGRAVLEALNICESDKNKITLLANQIIRGIEQDHAAFFNLTAKTNKVLPNESVLVMETTPAGYLLIACNEALKTANIKLISIEPHGASGRLVLSGPESEIDSAAEAALKVLNQMNKN